MRITGGEMGGRRVKVPSGDGVRPTQDRVRGALFSMLATRLAGARVLDLFAGTGAIGIEAISRGAGDAVWVEQSRRHVTLLKENIQTLTGLPHPRVVCDDAMHWLQHAVAESFDLVFADPPYEWARMHGFAPMASLLHKRGWVSSGGIFVAEQPMSMPAASLDQWELLRDRPYGDTRLAVYRLAESVPSAMVSEAQTSASVDTPSLDTPATTRNTGGLCNP